ncbi:hypothetical protein GFC30_2230 [Anoxybacillus amylolyticus]|uniref:Uncharacterized protein n=1 Tax=Anoxybacteroides amylolyticum TaxID=294699 RepID=A0A160F0X3_9BACL|nr:hypothetical protein GFC30_2230 [Anoxybacillus amylolyticus]
MATLFFCHLIIDLRVKIPYTRIDYRVKMLKGARI